MKEGPEACALKLSRRFGRTTTSLCGVSETACYKSSIAAPSVDPDKGGVDLTFGCTHVVKWNTAQLRRACTSISQWPDAEDMRVVWFQVGVGNSQFAFGLPLASAPRPTVHVCERIYDCNFIATVGVDGRCEVRENARFVRFQRVYLDELSICRLHVWVCDWESPTMRGLQWQKINIPDEEHIRRSSDAGMPWTEENAAGWISHTHIASTSLCAALLKFVHDVGHIYWAEFSRPRTCTILDGTH